MPLAMDAPASRIYLWVRLSCLFLIVGHAIQFLLIPCAFAIGSWDAPFRTFPWTFGLTSIFAALILADGLLRRRSGLLIAGLVLSLVAALIACYAVFHQQCERSGVADIFAPSWFLDPTQRSTIIGSVVSLLPVPLLPLFLLPVSWRLHRTRSADQPTLIWWPVPFAAATGICATSIGFWAACSTQGAWSGTPLGFSLAHLQFSANCTIGLFYLATAILLTTRPRPGRALLAFAAALHLAWAIYFLTEWLFASINLPDRLLVVLAHTWDLLLPLSLLLAGLFVSPIPRVVSRGFPLTANADDTISRP